MKNLVSLPGFWLGKLNRKKVLVITLKLQQRGLVGRSKVRKEGREKLCYWTYCFREIMESFRWRLCSEESGTHSEGLLRSADAREVGSYHTCMTPLSQRNLMETGVKRMERRPKFPYLKSSRKCFFSIKTSRMYTYYLKKGRKLFMEWIYKHYHTAAYFYFIKIH